MARSFPADVKLQCFYTEGYEKESGARLAWWRKKKDWETELRRKGINSTHVRMPRPVDKDKVPLLPLPSINPTKFALDKFRGEKAEEDALRAKYAQMGQKAGAVLMKPATADVKGQLYDGFTKEGKGRYAYLMNRKLTIPEQKYQYPITSSWAYGWRIGDDVQLAKPRYARQPKIHDTFFTRNGVPTLNDPTRLERSYTIA